jgi:hypothetical protein
VWHEDKLRKLERLKVSVADGTYSVAMEKVATRIIERMLVRLHPMWSGKANVSRDEPIVELTLYIDAAL